MLKTLTAVAIAFFTLSQAYAGSPKQQDYYCSFYPNKNSATPANYTITHERSGNYRLEVKAGAAHGKSELVLQSDGSWVDSDGIRFEKSADGENATLTIKSARTNNIWTVKCDIDDHYECPFYCGYGH